MDLTIMNSNDAKAIGDSPEDFCIEDVREALRVLREHAPSEAAASKTVALYASRIRKLKAEIATGRAE